MWKKPGLFRLVGHRREQQSPVHLCFLLFSQWSSPLSLGQPPAPRAPWVWGCGLGKTCALLALPRSPPTTTCLWPLSLGRWSWLRPGTCPVLCSATCAQMTVPPTALLLWPVTRWVTFRDECALVTGSGGSDESHVWGLSGKLQSRGSQARGLVPKERPLSSPGCCHCVLLLLRRGTMNFTSSDQQ